MFPTSVLLVPLDLSPAAAFPVSFDAVELGVFSIDLARIPPSVSLLTAGMELELEVLLFAVDPVLPGFGVVIELGTRRTEVVAGVLPIVVLSCFTTVASSSSALIIACSSIATLSAASFTRFRAITRMLWRFFTSSQAILNFLFFSARVSPRIVVAFRAVTVVILTRLLGRKVMYKYVHVCMHGGYALTGCRVTAGNRLGLYMLGCFAFHDRQGNIIDLRIRRIGG